MALNPTVYDTTAENWLQIAAGVEIGLIVILEPRASYRLTYRVAGDPAPSTPDDIENSPKVQSLSVDIASDAPIDVYIYTVAGIDGKVTVYE